MHFRDILIGLLFIVSVYSYCNPIQDVCSAANLRCPDSTQNGCAARGHPIDFNFFDVVCGGHLYLPAGYIKGRAAMGHDFNEEQEDEQTEVTIGMGLDATDGNQTYSFVSASDVTWPVGQLYPNNSRAFYSGRLYSLPPSVESRADHCASGASCVNYCFGNARDYYQGVSELFADQAATATTSTGSGTLTISCSARSSYYFITLRGSAFNSVTGYTLSTNCNASAHYVFNIAADEATVTFAGTPFPGNSSLYNVVRATRVHIRTPVHGSILNLHGDVEQETNAILYGWLISDQCRGLTKIERPLCYNRSANSTVPTTSTSTSGSTSASASARSAIYDPNI